MRRSSTHVEYGTPLPDLSGFRCISRDMPVDDGFGYAQRHDLYENACGDRISVAVSPWVEARFELPAEETQKKESRP